MGEREPIGVKMASGRRINATVATPLAIYV